jgi:hypothetical protein
MKTARISASALIVLSFIASTTIPSTTRATPPVALCKNAALEAGVGCKAELAVADIDNGSFDPDGNPFFLTFSPPGPFNKGNHTVTLTATDNQGESATCTAQVSVVDRSAPVVTCPADIEIDNSTGLCSAPASYPLPVIVDNCPGPFSISYSRSSGSVFDVGTNVVVGSVTDAAGNPSMCAFNVIVHDAEPPVLITSCPGNITVQAEKDQAAVPVSYQAPNATDNCAIAAVTCEPASGFSFPIGDTPVTCTATDIHGNVTSCGFIVTILPPEGLQTLDDMIEFIEQLGLAKGPQTSLIAKLQAADRASRRENNNAATKQIGAFIHEINAMNRTGRIDPQAADELIGAATDIINELHPLVRRPLTR